MLHSVIKMDILAFPLITMTTCFNTTLPPPGSVCNCSVTPPILNFTFPGKSVNYKYYSHLNLEQIGCFVGIDNQSIFQRGIVGSCLILSTSCKECLLGKHQQKNSIAVT